MEEPIYGILPNVWETPRSGHIDSKNNKKKEKLRIEENKTLTSDGKARTARTAPARTHIKERTEGADERRRQKKGEAASRREQKNPKKRPQQKYNRILPHGFSHKRSFSKVSFLLLLLFGKERREEEEEEREGEWCGTGTSSSPLRLSPRRPCYVARCVQFTNPRLTNFLPFSVPHQLRPFRLLFFIYHGGCARAPSIGLGK